MFNNILKFPKKSKKMKESSNRLFKSHNLILVLLF